MLEEVLSLIRRLHSLQEHNEETYLKIHNLAPDLPRLIDFVIVSMPSPPHLASNSTL